MWRSNMFGRPVLVSSLVPVLLLGAGTVLGPGQAVERGRAVPVQHREVPDDPLLGRPAPPKFYSRGGGVFYGTFNSVQVNVDELGNNIPGDAANEPSIAINPVNPDVMVIGWRQFDNVASNFRQAGWGYSGDSGATWTFPGVLNPGVFRSDPVLDSDADGNIYYYSLSVTGNDWHCDMYISGDGGVTWLGPNFGFGGDKAWFTVDKTGSIGHGNIYSAWSTAGNNYFPNQFSRSTDGGFGWMDPVEIPPRRQVWGTLTVDSAGDLYVSGQRSGNIYVSKSTNAKFAAVTPAFDFTLEVPLGGTFTAFSAPNPAGLAGQVWVAADNSDGPTGGNVYLLSSMNPPGPDPLDVLFSRSEDGGLTWSSPVRVNDDPRLADAWQWFGTMSVAPNGRIDVIWNDTRNSLQANICETFYSYSLDGGRSWSRNVSMTPPWNSHVGWPNQNKIGDYYDMVSDDTGAGLAYSATFNGEQDVYYLRIEPPPPLLPNAFSLLRGLLLSGDLSSMFDSDDDSVVARPWFVLSTVEAPIQIVIEGTATTGSPLELGFLLESRVSILNITQKIELFNYGTGTWEQVDFRFGKMSDSIVHVLIPVNPSRFINAATLEMKAKVSFKEAGAILSYPWSAGIDRANFTVLP